MNVVDVEIIKNTGSDRIWICMFCSNNLFPFAMLNDHKLIKLQVKAITTIVAVLTAILPTNVQH